MDLEARAKSLLSASDYINIATSTLEGSPWNTPVTGKCDRELNFYWSSWKHAIHSQNILANPQVFITLYDSTRKRGDNHRRCLYLSGVAQEAKNLSTIRKAILLLYGNQTKEQPDAFTGDANRRIYQATIQKLWLNDVSERQVTSQTSRMRIEVSLEKLRTIL